MSLDKRFFGSSNSDCLSPRNYGLWNKTIQFHVKPWKPSEFQTIVLFFCLNLVLVSSLCCPTDRELLLLLCEILHSSRWMSKSFSSFWQNFGSKDAQVCNFTITSSPKILVFITLMIHVRKPLFYLLNTKLCLSLTKKRLELYCFVWICG